MQALLVPPIIPHAFVLFKPKEGFRLSHFLIVSALRSAVVIVRSRTLPLCYVEQR